ncbi:hypothetical protein [Thiococcus pfennigii]|uniref:DUF7931 domain-containing protein n=1 Tax=Thiococcus pfennigii TaxID=1057 RepID=UPI0019032C96|nr:hypothetical protein [Thiococcus pfennigii]MBK1731681.1 hypothetical protein [Thiococcus pfennigii]
MADLDASTPEPDFVDCVLGEDAGTVRCATVGAAARAVAAMAAQARRELTLLTPDLEPALYDQPAFLEALRRLALARAGHRPVRILLVDVEAAVRRSPRLVELARRLTSAVQIAGVPGEFAESCDAYLLVDDDGYCLRRRAAPSPWLVDFANPATVRPLRAEFDRLWEQADTPPELRRLHL